MSTTPSHPDAERPDDVDEPRTPNPPPRYPTDAGQTQRGGEDAVAADDDRAAPPPFPHAATPPTGQAQPPEGGAARPSWQPGSGDGLPQNGIPRQPSEGPSPTPSGSGVHPPYGAPGPSSQTTGAGKAPFPGPAGAPFPGPAGPPPGAAGAYPPPTGPGPVQAPLPRPGQIGPHGITPNEERVHATTAHWLPILSSFIAPLVFYLADGPWSPFVKENARRSLNFELTLLIGYIVSGLLMVVVVGFVLYPLVWICGIIFHILAATAANRGEVYKYPITVDFVK